MKKGRKTRCAGIVDLGGGTYRVRVTMYDPKVDKRVERDRQVQAASLAEAMRLKLALEDALKEELCNAAESKPRRKLGEAADAWLAEITARRREDDPTQLHLTHASRLRYEGSVRDFVKPFFGELIAESISAEDVRGWRQHLLEHGYKRATINGHHRVLKQILASVDNKAAAKVPELNEKVDARITRKQPNLLTAQELDRFLAVIKQQWPQHYAMVLVLFTTTMRIGTVLALRREDIDLESMEIVAQRRLSAGVVTPGVKRDRFGEDAPPLLPEVHEALKAHWSTFNEAQLGSGLMFPNTDGMHHSPSILRKCFVDASMRAGITKRFTPHGCRRTGAKLYGRTEGTRMAMEIAGHRTLAMHHHYAPVDAAEKQLAARKTFGHLTVLSGGSGESEKVGDLVGDRERRLDEASGK
jgi:integrase